MESAGRVTSSPRLLLLPCLRLMKIVLRLHIISFSSYYLPWPFFFTLLFFFPLFPSSASPTSSQANFRGLKFAGTKAPLSFLHWNPVNCDRTYRTRTIEHLSAWLRVQLGRTISVQCSIEEDLTWLIWYWWSSKFWAAHFLSLCNLFNKESGPCVIQLHLDFHRLSVNLQVHHLLLCF